MVDYKEPNHRKSEQNFFFIQDISNRKHFYSTEMMEENVWKKIHSSFSKFNLSIYLGYPVFQFREDYLKEFLTQMHKGLLICSQNCPNYAKIKSK